MGLLYQIAYRLGFKPWDTGVSPPELIDLVDGERALPTGRALDLGCGTGTNAVYLAEHGWAVTGVDNVERALAAARLKAMRAGVEPRFVKGDVTHLTRLGIGDGYNLLLDLGCYHSLPTTARNAYADGMTAVAAPGATLLIYGFLPAVLPKRIGISAEELRARFQGWALTRVSPGRNWLPTKSFEMRRRP